MPIVPQHSHNFVGISIKSLKASCGLQKINVAFIF